MSVNEAQIKAACHLLRRHLIRSSCIPFLALAQLSFLLSSPISVLVSFTTAYRIFLTMRLQDFSSLSLSSPHRVLIVGCAYGGISALVNLLDLSLGRARQSVYPGPDFKGIKSRDGVEITVIDERDGYCK